MSDVALAAGAATPAGGDDQITIRVEFRSATPRRTGEQGQPTSKHAHLPSRGAASSLPVLLDSVSCSAGLELLFSRQKKHTLTFPVNGATPADSLTMRFLIDYLRVNLCTERPEMFVADDSVSVENGGGWMRAWLVQCLAVSLVAHVPPACLRDCSVWTIHSRPGILVLINDTDWELEDGLEYRLKSGDTIVFISTLHGG